MSQLIAIVEDETDIRELLKIQIEKSGFRAKTFSTGRQFNEFIKGNFPDLVLLDMMLPDTDGLEICRQIRADLRLKLTPIIILSARADEFDKILGLEMGADFYVPKPFSTQELLARIRTLLRVKPTDGGENSPINIDNILVIDQQKFAVTVYGRPVSLTNAEFRLLKLLAQKRGHVFTRDKILTHLWGEDKIVLDRTIDVHIKNLREKLGEAGSLIQNIRGIGYKLDTPNQDP